MSRETPRNLAASVRQRLFNRAQEKHEDFGLVLTKYGLERFLHRLAHSQYREQFALKGALLFELWTHHPYANRFLFVCASRSKHLPLGGDVNEQTLSDLVQRLTAARRFAMNVGKIKFSTNAVKLWIERYPRLTREIPGINCGSTQGDVVRDLAGVRYKRYNPTLKTFTAYRAVKGLRPYFEGGSLRRR